MCKIVIIGVGDAGRNVLKILRDEGLEDIGMMSLGAFLDNGEDIHHHNLITMTGHCGRLVAFSEPRAWKYLAEGAVEQIEYFLERAFNRE